MKEKTQAKIGWALIIGVVIFVPWMASSITSCTDAYAPTDIDNPEIYADPQGALNPYCLDSGFMLNPDDVLIHYNSPNLETVYSVDSIDLANQKALITPIYHTDPNLPVCVKPYFQNYDSTNNVPGQDFHFECKEQFQPWLLALDTCQ